MSGIPYWHKFNPWSDHVVYLPSVKVAAEMLDKSYMYRGTVEFWVNVWKAYGDQLDPYILPSPNGDHSLGIRYGAEPGNYLSPYGDRDRRNAREYREHPVNSLSR